MGDILSNLDLHWRFDGDYADSSGNGRTGTALNSPTFTTSGKIGSAVTLNGSNMNVKRDSYQLPTSAGSVSLWFKPTRAYNSGIDEVLWDIVSGGTLFRCQHYSDNNWYVGFYQGGSEYRVSLAASSTNWVQNSWNHLCLTYTSGGTSTLYLQGASAGTHGSTDTTISSSSLRVGAYTTDSNGFSGNIDDFRIYSRALVAADVTQLYAFGLPTLRHIQARFAA